MIINWLLYSILVGGILAIAGLAFEYVARALRLPTRWIWIAIMALSTIFSAMTLMRGFVARSNDPRAVEHAYPAAGSAIDTDSVPVNVWSARDSLRVRPSNHRKSSAIQPALATVLNTTGGLSAEIGVDEQAFRSYNAPLLVTCGALTLISLVVLAVSFARLSGVAYALDHAVVEGVPVLLSRNIGPALLGIRRFRVVLPRWVTEMSSGDVRTILAHEQEHALAGDPTLTLGALVMSALQPWNPALWFALSHLRLATEADCDARVLGADGDARQYGHLLVDVYQRAQSGLSPLTSFVTRTSQLEARIRRMVHSAPRSFSPKTIGAFASALMLCALAYSFEVTAQRSMKIEPVVGIGSVARIAPAAKQQRPQYDAAFNNAPSRAKTGRTKAATPEMRAMANDIRPMSLTTTALRFTDSARMKVTPDSTRVVFYRDTPRNSDTLQPDGNLRGKYLNKDKTNPDSSNVRYIDSTNKLRGAAGGLVVGGRGGGARGSSAGDSSSVARRDYPAGTRGRPAVLSVPRKMPKVIDSSRSVTGPDTTSF